jgi:hypoxanthine-DNA glycosylase
MLDFPDAPPPRARLVGLAPVLRPDTRVLVLGSFPGAASLAAQQYYAHPRNRFWPVLSAVWGVDLVALPYAQRLDAMLARGVGLWDVFASCAREGSLDSAIRDAQPNDLASLAVRAPGLRAVLHNGQASARERRATDALGVDVHVMPSTSPANAAWSLERHRLAWAGVLGRYDPA